MRVLWRTWINTAVPFLPPDLSPLQKIDFSDIYRTDPGAFLDVILPLSHKVWSGEKEYIELADLRPAINAADIKEATRQKIVAILEANHALFE